MGPSPQAVIPPSVVGDKIPEEFDDIDPEHEILPSARHPRRG